MDLLEQARTLFLAGIDELQTENYSKAEELFRSSLTLAPGRASSLDNLSVCMMHLNRLSEAQETCRRSLQINVHSSTPWFNLGLIQRLMDQPLEAIASLQKSIELDPNYPDSWHYSGVVLASQNRHPEAISCFEKVLALTRDHMEAMCALAVSLSELKFHFTAMAVLEKAATIAPEHSMPHSEMGRLYRVLMEMDKATACLRKALERNPPDREWHEYAIAAMTGETLPLTAPKYYVAGLFNRYAGNFEKHLTEKLEYKTPEILHAHMRPLLGDGLDIIDLGCGTGLMGALVKDQAKWLAGLDLSQKMLDEAGKKNVYDLLILGDINDVLANRDDTYDVVVSADVFIYLGDLSETFRLVDHRLRSGGVFAFSVEGCDGDYFCLNPSMRYSYSAAYIQQLAKDNSLAVRTFAHDFMRFESSAPDGKITGYYVVLQKQ